MGGQQQCAHKLNMQVVPGISQIQGFSFIQEKLKKKGQKHIKGIDSTKIISILIDQKKKPVQKLGQIFSKETFQWAIQNLSKFKKLQFIAEYYQLFNDLMQGVRNMKQLKNILSLQFFLFFNKTLSGYFKVIKLQLSGQVNKKKQQTIEFQIKTIITQVQAHLGTLRDIGTGFKQRSGLQKIFVIDSLIVLVQQFKMFERLGQKGEISLDDEYIKILRQVKLNIKSLILELRMACLTRYFLGDQYENMADFYLLGTKKYLERYEFDDYQAKVKNRWEIDLQDY